MCSVFFFFKQKTAYEMRISDWSSDVCSSDLALDQQRLGGMVKSAIADRLRELDVAPLLGQALQAALAEGRHQPLLDAMVKWGSKTLELNEHLIHQMVHDNSNAIVRFTGLRSEEHTSELQSLMRISYAVFCLKTKHTLEIC